MKRNILFITSDQQRYDSLGCTGGTIARTFWPLSSVIIAAISSAPLQFAPWSAPRNANRQERHD